MHAAFRCMVHACFLCQLALTPSSLASPGAVIKDFCKILAVDNKQVQGVIRLAKKNGEKLGFLA